MGSIPVLFLLAGAAHPCSDPANGPCKDPSRERSPQVQPTSKAAAAKHPPDSLGFLDCPSMVYIMDPNDSAIGAGLQLERGFIEAIQGLQPEVHEGAHRDSNSVRKPGR